MQFISKPLLLFSFHALIFSCSPAVEYAGYSEQ